MRHASLLHSETCARRGKHLHASIIHSKCKHGDMQTCFSLGRKSSLLLRSQANWPEFAYIKAHPAPPCVWSAKPDCAQQCGRVKKKERNSVGCWPIEANLCTSSPGFDGERGFGAMFTGQPQLISPGTDQQRGR